MRASWILVLVAGCGFNTSTKPTPSQATSNFVFNGEAISAANPPAPLAGGTLTASRVHPTWAFASNPDKGVVEVVDWDAASVLWTADVGAQSEPGRIVEDESGMVYVALRREGAIAKLDPAGKTITKLPACPAPRGLLIGGGSLTIACQSGELVTMALDGSGRSIQQLDRDLRDVVALENGNTYLTHFRAGDVMHVQSGTRALPQLAPDHVRTSGTITQFARYEPEVAWRAVSGPAGSPFADSLYVAHQYATTRTVPTKRDPNTPVPYYGNVGASGCPSGQVVFTALTRFIDGAANGTMLLPGQGPAVDIAVSSKGKVAVAIPGSPQRNAKTNTVFVFEDSKLQPNPSCDMGQPLLATIGQGDPVAVAFTASGYLLVQTREPSKLVVTVPSNRYGTSTTPTTTEGPNALAVRAGDFKEIALSATTHDTGFSIFHTPTTSAIACMSCHPEGGEDGHTWNFDIGKRRTQSMRGGVGMTAPFHWSGDLSDMAHLASDVFTERMGGANVSAPQADVLAKWIDRIPNAPARSGLDASVVARGSAVYAKAQCASCHSGDRLTNNETRDVGTGGKFQVPSLVGVSARAPFMHDGCAPTMLARFTNPSCGGKEHGSVSGLSATELSDLSTFLDSL